MRIHASINRMVNKEDSAIKAYASVTMDGMFAVHGLRVIETEKGRFVNMPSTSYTDKDGNKQYSDTLPRHNQVGENCRKSGCAQCL
ncbi:MAG: septation protein SpoVG family protein [Ruminococcus sp.]